MNTQLAVAPMGAFGGAGLPALPTGGETAATSQAAQAKAMVEARYAIAQYRPRNWDQVRQDLLRECKRPTFANNKSTYYVKPIGQGVEGLGIRFVEVALRCMTNVLIETPTIYEDSLKEVLRVGVTDLEANITYDIDIRVSKTVERSKPMDDGSYISVRKNSYGRDVYTVPANDDDLLNKRGALISKAVRTLGLRIVPGDLQDEAEMIIKEVRLSEVAKDPGAARKRLIDSFDELGVSVTQLAAYLDHEISTCSPVEIERLRGIYGAIRDGEATWASVMDSKQAKDKDKPKDKTNHPAKPQSKPADAAHDAAKIYPEADFERSLPSWSRNLQAGKVSISQIEAMAKSKGAFSEGQRERLMQAAQPATQTAPTDDPNAPDLSPDTLLKRIAEAGTLDELDDVGSLIGEVSNPDHRASLTDAYRLRRVEIGE